MRHLLRTRHPKILEDLKYPETIEPPETVRAYYPSGNHGHLLLTRIAERPGLEIWSDEKEFFVDREVGRSQPHNGEYHIIHHWAKVSKKEAAQALLAHSEVPELKNI